MSGLDVKLEVFEGPLDLLLHLVKKDKLNIYDIPISRITRQYLEYLDLMKTLNIDLASEFLAMAATLMYIKSRMLLPELVDDEEEDPREDLMRRLLEYQLFKDAAEQLKGLTLLGRDVFTHAMTEEELEKIGTVETELEASFFDLMKTYQSALKRIPSGVMHEVEYEPMTIDQKIEQVQSWLTNRSEGLLEDLFGTSRDRFDLVLTFVAVLELVRRMWLSAVQYEAFGAVYLRRRMNGINGH